MMQGITDVLLQLARAEDVPISLSELLNPVDTVCAILTDQAPDWLTADLSNEGLTIYRDRRGNWFIGRLSE